MTDLPPADSMVVFRQSTSKLLRVLPLALLMAGGSLALFLVGMRVERLVPTLAGGLGLAFFGPALLILAAALVRPNYLVVEPERLRFRLSGLEADIPWNEILEVSGGMGWPSLTFHDCDRVTRHFRLGPLRWLGWPLEIPTRFASLVTGKPLANVIPPTRGQLAVAFRRNESSFGFHCGLPTSTLEGTSSQIIAAMRRASR